MIVTPEKMDFSRQRFSAIIYGSPGVGKSTLALSAPAPVLIDFDDGVSRVAAQHRKVTIVCGRYEDVLQDIQSPAMSQFETVVIDTGGSFVTYLKDWALRTQPGCRLKNGQFNALKGFGAVKTEFGRFVDTVKTTLHKNIIFVFHSQEQQDKDGNPVQRLLCEGSVRNTVWNPCDFGGFVQIIAGERYICFTPEQEYFAKGSHGITGRMKVPELTPGTPNDFMTRLFQAARDSITAETDECRAKQKQYDEAMKAGRYILEGVVDEESANAAIDDFGRIEHSLTSRAELSAAWNGKMKQLGLSYDRETRTYKKAG